MLVVPINRNCSCLVILVLVLKRCQVSFFQNHESPKVMYPHIVFYIYTLAVAHAFPLVGVYTNINNMKDSMGDTPLIEKTKQGPPLLICEK